MVGLLDVDGVFEKDAFDRDSCTVESLPLFDCGKRPAAYWAYSFGVTSLAFDLILMHARGLGGFFDWISIVGLVVANAAVAILAVVTLVLLGKGKLIPKPALANQPASPAVR